MTPWEGGLVQYLTPRASSTPNTYSGLYGLQKFPFHSDLAHWRLPPRYLLLRCDKGFKEAPTFLLDGQKLVENVSIDILKRAIFKPRRPMNGAITLLRLYEPVDDGFRLRWDEVFIKPASKVGDIANQSVRQYLSDCGPIALSLADLGDTLLIDNWRMLHARGSIPIGCEDRKIERVYLEELN